MRKAGEAIPSKSGQHTASVHDFIDSGVRGFINDGDDGYYMHREGQGSFREPMEDFGNPIEGGKSGDRDTRPIPRQQMQDVEQMYRDQQEYQRFGGSSLAQQQVLGSTASYVG